MLAALTASTMDVHGLMANALIPVELQMQNVTVNNTSQQRQQPQFAEQQRGAISAMNMDQTVKAA